MPHQQGHDGGEQETADEAAQVGGHADRLVSETGKKDQRDGGEDSRERKGAPCLRHQGKDQKDREQAADRTGGPGGERIGAGVQLHRHGEQVPADARHQVQEKIPRLAEEGLRIGADRPQGDHVGTEMLDAKVQEHGGEEPPPLAVFGDQGRVQGAEGEGDLEVL